MRLPIHQETMVRLREEYGRLERESNPGPPTWDDLLSTVLSIGLERLKGLNGMKLLALLESEMLG